MGTSKDKKPYQKPSLHNISALETWGQSCCKDKVCTGGAKTDTGKPASNKSAT